MKWIKKTSGGIAVALAVALGGVAVAAGGGSGWNSAGGDKHNTRFQASEQTLSVDNVSDLGVKWAFETGGDVSATPAVDDENV